MSRWMSGFAGLILMVAASASADTSGVIRGQVNFAGTIPTPERLKIGGDRYCEDIHSRKPLLREDVIINPNKTLKNVVVWISGGGPDDFKPQAATTQKAALTQQGCAFYPRVLAVQTGQQVELKNVDPSIHNINAIPRQNKRFNKAMIGEKAVDSVSFDKPEVAVKLKCDIHPWMVAWVAVFNHPLFAVSGDDGTFEITGLPPGEYVVQTWHEKFGGTQTEVLVDAGKPAEVIFTYTDTGSAAGTQTQGPSQVTGVTTGTE